MILSGLIYWTGEYCELIGLSNDASDIWVISIYMCMWVILNDLNAVKTNQ